MRQNSIRIRLAAAYFLSQAVLLALFGVGAWIAMRSSVRSAVDHDLRERIRDVTGFIGQELSQGEAELLEELQEHSQLGLGGGLLQLSIPGGRTLFRSGGLKSTPIQMPSVRPGDPDVRFSWDHIGSESFRRSVRVAFQTVTVQNRRFSILVAEPMDEFNESFRRFESVLAILAPLFLMLASAVGFWMSKRALAPVDRITQDACAIGASSLSARLQLPRAKDELWRLTSTLNQMLDRIEAQVKRIVQFTADASHELRAPLTLIHTAAEFSLRRERSREELVDAMKKVLRESERTSALVDNLLLLARADSNADEAVLAPIDVALTGRQAAARAAILCRARNIAFVTGIPDREILLNADERLLEQLWLILLDNAVKYTPEGGEVRFAMHPADARIEVSVIDTGIGMSADDLSHVYDRFWRADKVRSRANGGAGLGLSIARWIVQRHRGEIKIDSSPGRGSRVTVRLRS